MRTNVPEHTAIGWADLLRENSEEVLAAWRRTAEANVSGRLTAAELHRDIRDIFDALISGAEGGEPGAAGVTSAVAPSTTFGGWSPS